MIDLIESTANMLRGMCMDARIPDDTKDVLWERVRKLDETIRDAIERQTREHQVWEDTRTQRDELLAHLAGKAPLPQWAAEWIRA